MTGEYGFRVVANCDHLANLKYSKALPYAFTEHGAIMAASVLNTPQADAIVSWNFTHIVRLDRIRGFNLVNSLKGYDQITILSPKEIILDEPEAE